MKNLIKSTFACVIGSVLLFACHDDDHTHDEPVVNDKGPKIMVEAPTTDAVYGLKDTVFMKAHISHSSDVHTYSAEITRIENDSVVWTYKGDHEHSMHKHVEGYWINNVKGHSDMKLTIKAADHQSNATIKTVDFHCHPM